MTTEAKINFLRGLVKAMPGDTASAQCERLREALSRYPLTSFEAMRHLDIYHCPARILQLRQAGEQIITSWATVTTEQGERHRVGLYSLAAG